MTCRVSVMRRVTRTLSSLQMAVTDGNRIVYEGQSNGPQRGAPRTPYSILIFPRATNWCWTRVKQIEGSCRVRAAPFADEMDRTAEDREAASARPRRSTAPEE